jgi:thiol-disulfide isomerase/thioredoxin
LSDERLSADDLIGRPAVIALWSTHCPYQRAAMSSFDSLAREFAPRNVRFIVLADDQPGKRLDSAIAVQPWRATSLDVAVADGQLARRFDYSRTGRRDSEYRVEFVLPSYLLVDERGIVRHRTFGPSASLFRAVLDSLVQQVPSDTQPAT